MTDLGRELAIASDLAREGGAIALEIYSRPITAEQKADRSPVTEADKRVNKFLCEGIANAFPNDLVIGEESGFTGPIPQAGRVWFIDPIDGTKDFILKNGEWSVMLGLAIDGRAVAGVVYEPAMDRMYYGAEGEGAWRVSAGERVRLERTATKAPSDTIIVNSRNHPDPRIQAVADKLGITQQFQHGSVGCKLARIAEGLADVYFNFSGKCSMWDTCGPEAIIRQAGGDLVNFAGDNVVYAGKSTGVHEPFFAAATAAVLGPIGRTVRAMSDDLQPE